MPYNCAHLPFSPSKMPNFATSHGPRCRKTDVHNGLLIIIFCFLSFSGIHHASLAVAALADGHPPLLVVVALRHIGRISPVAVAHFASFSPTIPATGFRKPFDILSAVAQTTSNSPTVINIIQFILRLVNPFATIYSRFRLAEIPPERGEHERLHH